jgi:hypothetical protein
MQGTRAQSGDSTEEVHSVTLPSKKEHAGRPQESSKCFLIFFEIAAADLPAAGTRRFAKQATPRSRPFLALRWGGRRARTDYVRKLGIPS